MKSIQLFHIYHSFLLKMWYLFVYLILIVLSLVLALTAVQYANQEDKGFRLGIVDKDHSKETQLILGSVGKGSNFGKHVTLKQYSEKTAKQRLSKHELDGYFVFDKGMTHAFYHQGQLPITVYTYDQQSTKSVVISQLTHSVYDRLMLSMGGILSYTHLTEKPSSQDMVMLMTDLLFTGLNRVNAFNYEPVKVYDTGSYYVVTGYLLSIFILCLSLFSVLKMNQETALKERLQLFHFSFEKLTFVRGAIAWFYSMIWAILGFLWINHTLDGSFESYNWPTVAIQLTYFVTFLVMLLILIELISKNWMNLLLKCVLTLIFIVFSGITVPTIFFQHSFNSILATQPFSLVTNQMLEITLNNFILDTHPAFYISFIAVALALCVVAVWRYRR